LMQSLPNIAPQSRLEAARRYLARAADERFSPNDTERFAAEAVAITEHPDFAALFETGSRAEVPIVGKLGEGMIVGQVDRLVVTADAVLIADYKTNQPAPRMLEEVKNRYPSYIAQLALYRAVLARLYPARSIRAALVWTESPHLMEIPAALLD